MYANEEARKQDITKLALVDDKVSLDAKDWLISL